MAINRLERMSARRIDNSVTNAKQLNEVYRKINQSDSVRYTIGAMQPIDPEYTANSYKQGERICDQLRSRLSDNCSYEYQGSVTNNTHIKAKSDIDILVLTGKFVMVAPPQSPSFPYAGNTIQDLVDLRNDCVSSLRKAFPTASIDESGSKAIAVEGGSLTRKVDVVPSNWLNTDEYYRTQLKTDRAVQILDSKKLQRVTNTPFLHNAKIDEKDTLCRGGLRKAARLMKSLKYDTDDMDLSSYDIVSIAFNIDTSSLTVPTGYDLLLLDLCLNFCETLVNSKVLRESLNVPDGHRRIFTLGHATLAGLNQLTDALRQLSHDVLMENTRSFRKLAEARIEY